MDSFGTARSVKRTWNHGDCTILEERKERMFKKGLRVLDERRLNALLDSVPRDVASKLLTKALPRPDVERGKSNGYGGGHRSVSASGRVRGRRQRKRMDDDDPERTVRAAYVNIPMTVSRIISASGLMDEPDPIARIHAFIGYCRLKDYSFLTAKRYLKIAQRHGAFGKDVSEIGSRLPVLPDPTVFTGRLHTRVVSSETYARLYAFLVKRISRFYVPILIPFYTALRTQEILQFDSAVLEQLRERRRTVNIKRKQSSLKRDAVYWKPIYTSYFVQFVDRLIALYGDEYETFRTTGVSVLLFYVTPKTLNNRLRCAYSMANPGLLAPLGFGVHSCRNMTASLMAETTQSLPDVQAMLQHNSMKTTARYIKTDYKYLREQFDRITDGAFSSVISELREDDGLVR